MGLIKLFFDIITPRYVTERVVLTRNDAGEYVVICRECDYDDFKYATGFGACEFRGTSKAFNLFGFALSPTVLLDK